MISKRLSDAIVAAHLIACEEDKKDIALLLIEALELELTRIGGDQDDRRNKTIGETRRNRWNPPSIFMRRHLAPSAP